MISPPSISVSFKITPVGSFAQLLPGVGGEGAGGGAGAGGSNGDAEREWQVDAVVRVPVHVNKFTSSACKEP